jgi:hypothetical protein
MLVFSAAWTWLRSLPLKLWGGFIVLLAVLVAAFRAKKQWEANKALAKQIEKLNVDLETAHNRNIILRAQLTAESLRDQEVANTIAAADVAAQRLEENKKESQQVIDAAMKSIKTDGTSKAVADALNKLLGA